MNELVDPKTLTISATEFKAGCLALMDDLKDGRLEKVIVTKRGQVVAELCPPAIKPRASLYGALKGMIVFPPNADLTSPAFDGEWNAEKNGPIGGME